MDTSRDKPMGTDGQPHIWLRYTTQFTTAGRTHTIEMGIPVPVGASAELREQLIREAETGMEQLTRRVENRVTQMLQRNSHPAQPPYAPPPSPPSQSPQPPREPVQRGAVATGYEQGASAHVGAGSTPQAPSTGRTQAATGQAETQAVPREVQQPVRQTIGANMPSTPGIPGDANSNMKLSQFMQFIRETWGLTPKQAMDLLNLKSLNGLNYREVLRELQPLVEQQAGGTPAAHQKPPLANQARPAERPSNPPAPAPTVAPLPSRSPSPAPGDHKGSPLPSSPPSPLRSSTSGTAPPVASTAGPSSTSKAPAGDRRGGSQEAAALSSNQVSPPAQAKAPVIPIRMVRDERRVFKFDEEEEDEGEEEIDEPGDDDSEQQRVMARIKLDELKEVRGTALANPARLTVLHNVLDSQISEAQLQRLMQAAWGVTTEKKLKVDQAEALISWAKEDYFVDEMEAVLAVIDEEDS